MALADIIQKNLARYDAIQEQLENYRVPPEKTSALVADVMSEGSRKSIEADPYWPKWNSPWWKITLLMEIGELQAVPRSVLEHFFGANENHVLHFFPLSESELPDKCNPYSDIMCHCALGTLIRIMNRTGFPVREAYPWMYEWLFKYRLPDGGYNCEDSAYRKPEPKSSIVSTLPPMEALLESRPAEELNQDERELLEKGAQYLLNHRFQRSLGGRILNEKWILPLFPRFYEYDVLRGLKFVVDWAYALKKTIELAELEEALAGIDAQITPEGMLPVGRNLLDERTIIFTDSGVRGEPVGVFPLLEEVSVINAPSVFLTREWYGIIKKLSGMV